MENLIEKCFRYLAAAKFEELILTKKERFSNSNNSQKP
jgi:hypothetical protein